MSSNYLYQSFPKIVFKTKNQEGLAVWTQGARSYPESIRKQVQYDQSDWATCATGSCRRIGWLWFKPTPARCKSTQQARSATCHSAGAILGMAQRPGGVRSGIWEGKWVHWWSPRCSNKAANSGQADTGIVVSNKPPVPGRTWGHGWGLHWVELPLGWWNAVPDEQRYSISFYGLGNVSCVFLWSHYPIKTRGPARDPSVISPPP